MSERIISFDILRGWAIIGNLVVHTFMLVSQVQGIAETDPASLTSFGIVLMAMIIVFGHWRGLFLMMSAAIHIFVMYRKLKRGIPRHVILVQELFKGFMLYLWAIFFYVFLSQWGPSKQWVETGSSSLNWKSIYHTDQFTNIAFAIIVSAVIFYILTSNKKLQNPLVGTVVFSSLALLFIYLAPLIYNASNTFWGVDFHNGGNTSVVGDKGWWDYIVSYFANQAVGRESPLFTHYAYSAVGAIIGIFISRKNLKPKRFVRVGYGLSAFFLVFSIFHLWLEGDMPQNFDQFTALVNFHVHPAWFVYLSLGMLLFVITLMLHIHEFNLRINWFKRLMWSRHSRRVGVFSLTVYSLASIQAVLRVSLSGIFNLFGWVDPGFKVGLGLPTGWTFLLIFLEMIMWFGILWFWEKGFFLYTVDWLFAMILKVPFMKKEKVRKYFLGDFLDVEGKVIVPTPIVWLPTKLGDDEKTEELEVEKTV
ncbi:MAG: hypothetical protein FK732_01240 [Asgard group archaeon]|nr:hypothetical protein [Asgard group archaeon]